MSQIHNSNGAYTQNGLIWKSCPGAYHSTCSTIYISLCLVQPKVLKTTPSFFILYTKIVLFYNGSKFTLIYRKKKNLNANAYKPQDEKCDILTRPWSGVWHFFIQTGSKDAAARSVFEASAAAVERVQGEHGALQGQSHFEPLLEDKARNSCETCRNMIEQIKREWWSDWDWAVGTKCLEALRLREEWKVQHALYSHTYTRAQATGQEFKAKQKHAVVNTMKSYGMMHLVHVCVCSHYFMKTQSQKMLIHWRVRQQMNDTTTRVLYTWEHACNTHTHTQSKEYKPSLTLRV